MPTDTSGFFSRGGVLFFSLLFNAFTAMTEVTIGYSQRPIVIRQNRFAMIHPSADALANTLLDLPIRFATILAFGVVIYYLTGLSYTPDAGSSPLHRPPRDHHPRRLLPHAGGPDEV
ncbi:hypothetical protein L7F22_044541 [Adiantum nelumboides]|nr:hypothetical protein [Adiantum nelumboides]